jgi:hypothetical protein
VDICEFISLLVIFFSLDGQLLVKLSGQTVKGAVTLQPILGASPRAIRLFCRARG